MSHATRPFALLQGAAQQLNQLASAGAYPAGDASPLALAAFLSHAAPMLSARGLASWIGVAASGLRARRTGREHTRAPAGVELQLTPDELARMRAEVRRFQWLEAERAGRNIWAERDASNPEAAAAVEWFRRHFGAWYLHEKGGLRIGG